MRTPPTGLEAAIRALDKRGTVTELAERLGITRAAVSAWGGTIPLNRLAQVEEITGLPRDVLRPDWREAAANSGLPRDMLNPSIFATRRSRKASQRTTEAARA